MTLGCRVNQYETDVLSGELCRMGFERSSFSEKCDVYVINTCAVTEESVRKSRQMVRRAIKNNKNAFVGVMGCASQLEAEAFSDIEGVTFICGTRNKHEMAKAISEYFLESKLPEKKVKVKSPEGALSPTLAVHSERSRAYVKIEDGCNGRCSYCVIPSLRGKIVTRDENEILAEVSNIAESGCHEVVLTGIETAAYGEGLPRLIRKIASVEGIERISMGSLEPSFMKPSFIDEISDIPILSRHFHISVQNGSDRILALMRRKYNSQMMLDNIAYIKKAMEGVTFSADVIVGFPCETEEDFEATCKFVRDVGFLHLHIFTYSKRPGTEAAEMDGQIPEAVKTERLHRLESIALEEKNKILTSMLEAKKPLSVLIETENGGLYTGHSESFAECGILCTDIIPCKNIKGSIIKAIPEEIKGGILVCRPL